MIQKIVFCVNYGHFEFLVMLFGLCNARGIFQRLMNMVFIDNIGKFIAVYLDDIVVLILNLDEHWKHLTHLSWGLELEMATDVRF